VTGIYLALAAGGWLATAVWVRRAVSGALAYRRAPRVSARPAPPDSPPASILVPARNEEANIAGCLAALAAQAYPRFEVIAVDDNSRDRTRELIAAAAAKDPRIAPFDAPPTPEGWTGKNHALAAAVGRAGGEWLLFTDADARLAPLALASAVLHAGERGLDLLTVLPRAVTLGLAERVLQPAAMGYLGSWFPLDRVNRPGDPLAFGNGQFLLIRRAAYDLVGGHAAVRGQYLEDVALAREAKRRGLKVECALGKRLLSVRMYDSAGRWRRGWHRIYLHAFDRRAGLLLARAAEVAGLAVLPPALLAVLVIAGPGAQGPARVAWALAAAGLGLATALSLLVAAKMHSAVGRRSAHWLLHPLAAAAIAVVLLGSARAAATGAPTRWR
jgi:chlorobactene glucosyltransferase